MKTSQQRLRFTQTVIALAVLAAFGQARAQEASPPPSSVSVGGIFVSGDSKDRARFGLYNGLREDSAYGILDFIYGNRDLGSGIWTTIEGRNLFLDTREAALTIRKPGDWKFVADYSEIVRYEPRTINSSMQGAGSTTPALSRLTTPGTGQEINLDQQRKGFGLSGFAWLGGDFKFEANFKTEDKQGSRIFGRGFACSGTWLSAGTCATSSTQWALWLTPDVIDSTIRQGEAKVSYTNGGLLVTAGYYGSVYNNSNGNITPSYSGLTTNNPTGAATAFDAGLLRTMQLPLALPPDNEAHQFFLQGAYRFSPTSALNFKYARTRATQNEDFASNGFSQFPPNQNSLDGKVDTTIAQAGFTARPMPKLSFLANVRYEERDNQTPIALYNIEGGETTRFTNGAATSEKLASKIEASYLFPESIRATVGFDWDKVDHGEFTQTSSVAGLSGIRQKTKEQGYRLELRRSMSETLTGFIQYSSSDREGDSPWLKPVSLSQGRGVREANDDPSCVPPPSPAFNNCIYNRTGIFPFMFEDRKRDKTKVMATWIPTDELSIQGYIESGKDKFTGPSEHGLRESSLKNFSLDGAYRVSDNWNLTGYASWGESGHLSGHSTGYDGDVKDKSTAFGFGLKGKASEQLLVTADLTYLKDDLTYKQELDPAGSATNAAILAATGGLPDVQYKLLRFQVSGTYLLDKVQSIRAVIGYERTDFNEWTWQWNGNSFLYSDNTTVGAQEKQSVTYGGIAYTYRFK